MAHLLTSLALNHPKVHYLFSPMKEYFEEADVLQTSNKKVPSSHSYL